MPSRTAVSMGLMQHSDDLLHLLGRPRAHLVNRAGISPLQHGWQCGRLAAQAHSTPELQLACWLHDIGHLAALAAQPGLEFTPADPHELVAARMLEPLFGPLVSEPVALHVAAKRFRLATNPRYLQILSFESRRSLQRQGGPMSAREASDFMAHPMSGDALRLRAWDECARLAEWHPASVESALSELAALIDEVRAQAH